MKTERYQAMMEEILEAPALLESYYRDREELTREFKELFLQNGTRRIYLTGAGSPYYVGMALKFAATKLLKIEATCSPASLFLNHEGFNVGENFEPHEIMLICPAESGHAKGQVLAARQARAMGIPVVCTCTEQNSVLPRECNIVLQKRSPREVALATTKGQLMAIYMLFLCFLETAKALGTVTESEYTEYLNAAAKIPASCRDAAEKTLAWFAAHQDIVVPASHYKIVGYGANFATVQEASLKFLECIKRPTNWFELEEFMHGPIRSIHPEDVVFLLCAEPGPEHDRTLKLRDVLLEHVTKNVILIQSENDADTDELALRFNAVNKDLLSAIEYLVPMQMLAYLIADSLGYDVTIRSSLAIKEAMEPSFKD